MTRTVLGFIVATALVALVLVLFVAEGNGADKVTICHKPAGSNPHTLTVAASAVNAHLQHGDSMGPCAGSPTL